jgi:thymidine phosphorylase
VSRFAAVEVIKAKRDGGELSPDMIRWILEAYVAGEVAEEQMSSLLMAIFFRGLNPDELSVWTAAMIASGERLDLSRVSRPTVDKHSTGGVGDKISLILCPLVAACGAAVPQLSGRGLGHTGGTLDKMEAIAGWRARLSNEDMLRQLDEVGVVICAAGDGLAPADRRLYALRDVTSTVESIPLISSSIMSKKIAEGTASLVLDVKTGRGAFMSDEGRARELAATMVALGKANGVRTTALLTNMDTPLGIAVGNGLEVAESIEVLRGGGPADIREETLALAREMVTLAGLDVDVERQLDNGAAYETWCAMVAAQGGDPEAPLRQAPLVETVTAARRGVVTTVDSLSVGVSAWRLGAGRARKEDPVSDAAGIRVLVREGDEVEAGQALFELHADDQAHLDFGRAALQNAVELDGETRPARPLIIDRIV